MRDRYHPAQKALHWATAILILAMIPAGLAMQNESAISDALFTFHKNAGVLVLALMLTRLALRFAYPPPPLNIPLAGVAHLTHWLLYAVVIVMAVSGILRVLAGGFPLESLNAIGIVMEKNEALANRAKGVHWAAHYAVIGLVLLHIAAALRHALRRDGVFSRML
ncbi:cytochrome b [Falsirhodobacter xinxiangensis]|uniref:cytochrome b n=1 Tax=Falsirhodobacter xinxiangensis TaxID=2530049 RepID=UPI0010A9E3D0|nr:cytochrome b [Rhodobacter xinxiangensis]